MSVLENEKSALKRGFEITEGEAAQIMVGVEIIRSPTIGQLFLKQDKVIEEILEIFGVENP